MALSLNYPAAQGLYDPANEHDACGVAMVATLNKVATTMHAKDPLEAHLRDELGQHPHTKARPVQAAIASACAFTAGGLIPFVGAFAPSAGKAAWSIVAFTVVGLVFTGIISAKTAGSKLLIPTLRVIAGGCLGMAITAGIGQLLHISGI